MPTLGSWPLGAVLLSVLVASAHPAAAQDKILRLNAHQEFANNVTFSPDGKTLTAFVKGQRYNEFSALLAFELVVPFNIADGKPIKEYQVPLRADKKTPLSPLPGSTAMMAPDGRNFAALGTDAKGIPDGSIVVYDTETWMDRITLQSPKIVLVSAAYSADSKHLITCGKEIVNEKETYGVIIVWDAKEGNQVAVAGDIGSPVTAVLLSPDGKVLVSGHADGAIMIWDMAAVKSKEGDRKPRTVRGHKQPVEALAFSANGKALLSGGQDKQVRLWSLENDKDMACLVGHARKVMLVGFLDDDRTPVSASEDGTIRIWDVAGDKEMKILKAPKKVLSAALSPDRKQIALGCEGGVLLWNLSPAKEEVKPPKEQDK